MLRNNSIRLTSIPVDVIGATGRRYQFKRLIQERPHFGRVWLASSGKDQYILKDVSADILSNFSNRIQPQLRESSHIRLPWDSIADQRILVYRYLTHDFLNLAREQLPLQTRKNILKSALHGIAELHAQDIVHLDIKPDNILVDCHQVGEEKIIDQVQVADLENAAHLPKGRCIKGMLAGNENWRSPEAHVRGELNKPADMFSFGITCIYAMLGRVILGFDEDLEKHVAQGALPALIRLQRQVSYFGDEKGINGLLKHIGDDEVNCQVLQMLWEERTADYIPYKPFTEWPDIENSEFKFLISGLANLDLTKRFTALEALQHPWFETF